VKSLSSSLVYIYIHILYFMLERIDSNTPSTTENGIIILLQYLQHSGKIDNHEPM